MNPARRRTRSRWSRSCTSSASRPERDDSCTPSADWTPSHLKPPIHHYSCINIHTHTSFRRYIIKHLVCKREAEWLRAVHPDWSLSTSTASPAWWTCCGRAAVPSVACALMYLVEATRSRGDNPRAWTSGALAARKTRRPTSLLPQSRTISSEPSIEGVD